MAYVLAIDTETNARDPRYDPSFRLLGVSYATSDSEGLYLPIGHIGDTRNVLPELVLQQLSSEVERSDFLVFHNAKFDLLTLYKGLGLDLYEANWFDTMLMQHMVNENLPSKALDFLGKYHFNEGKAKNEEFDKFIKTFGWSFLPVWMIEPYAVQDAILTWKLFQLLYPEMERQGFV